MNALFVATQTSEPEAFQEFLYAALTSAVMGLEVNVLLMSNSVNHLKLKSNDPIQHRCIESLNELQSFGVKCVFVQAEALREHSLRENQLCIAVTPLDSRSLKALFTSSDTVLSF